MESLYTLCDPQTNGGLMVAIDPAQRIAFENLLKQNNLDAFAHPIAYMTDHTGVSVEILNSR